MLNRFVGLNFCRTQNWSGRPWRSSCHTPLDKSAALELLFTIRPANFPRASEHRLHSMNYTSLDFFSNLATNGDFHRKMIHSKITR